MGTKAARVTRGEILPHKLLARESARDGRKRVRRTRGGRSALHGVTADRMMGSDRTRNDALESYMGGMVGNQKQPRKDRVLWVGVRCHDAGLCFLKRSLGRDEESTWLLGQW